MEAIASQGGIRAITRLTKDPASYLTWKDRIKLKLRRDKLWELVSFLTRIRSVFLLEIVMGVATAPGIGRPLVRHYVADTAAREAESRVPGVQKRVWSMAKFADRLNRRYSGDHVIPELGMQGGNRETYFSSVQTNCRS
jgi:hypothetical protein